MLLLIASMVIAPPAVTAFPERAPGLIEACLFDAVERGAVNDDGDNHKYICSGETAERFWAFLEEANVEPWEQDVEEEGRWLSRAFPLGGCFKRIRMADGSPGTTVVSCTVWIPRLAQ